MRVGGGPDLEVCPKCKSPCIGIVEEQFLDEVLRSFLPFPNGGPSEPGRDGMQDHIGVAPGMGIYG